MDMKLLHDELYCGFSEKKRVCPMQCIDFEYLEKKRSYYGGAVTIVDALGLRPLMTRQCNYNIPLIHQFFATVVFDDSPNIGMTWMSGRFRL